MSAPSTLEPPTLATLRRGLLAILVAGVAGMGAELLLIGHVEGALQLTPVMLLGLGLVALVWFAVSPGRVSARALQIVMALFVASGAAGVVLHYRGNAAFELEMYPKMAGIELVRETLTGATPVLAPGSMALLGLVGLASTFRHPALRPSD
jgi:hypothetical protein